MFKVKLINGLFFQMDESSGKSVMRYQGETFLADEREVKALAGKIEVLRNLEEAPAPVPPPTPAVPPVNVKQEPPPSLEPEPVLEPKPEVIPEVKLEPVVVPEAVEPAKTMFPKAEEPSEAVSKAANAKFSRKPSDKAAKVKKEGRFRRARK